MATLVTCAHVRTAIVVFMRLPSLELKSFGASRQRDLRLLEWLRARTLGRLEFQERLRVFLGLPKAALRGPHMARGVVG